MTNLEAAHAMLRVLREAGRLEPVDEARIATFLPLVAAVDADPANASLWREYRAAEATLRETDDSDFDYAGLLAVLSAKGGDPENVEP